VVAALGAGGGRRVGVVAPALVVGESMSAPASGLDPDEIDLGLGHGLRFVGWHPDRALNPQYADLPDCDLVGLVVSHPRGDDPSRRCVSGIQFDDAPAHIVDGRPTWRLETRDPLTVWPSLLCRICGDHGFIRGGRWVVA
jgi:hypothetical protein